MIFKRYFQRREFAKWQRIRERVLANILVGEIENPVTRLSVIHKLGQIDAIIASLVSGQMPLTF